MYDNMSSVTDYNPSEYRVLVVDDVAANVLLLKILLSNEKFGVITAAGGNEAIEKVHNEKPDLVLLDVMMPDKSGFEVTKVLKSDRETADIPIIFLTALNNSMDIVKSFRLGGNDFISKPFSKDELIARVKHQISLVAAKRIIIRQKDELQKIITGRDKLYSVIAHDLRSPMGTIKMVLNLFFMSLTPEQIGQEMYDLLANANHTIEDLFSLLDNLLKWTKSQTGRLNVVYQDFDITEVLKGVTEIFTMVAQSKKITVKINANKSINVHADIDMIKTICRNFLSNAIKFSKEGGVIETSASVENNMAVIAVKDYGCGIPKENQEKLMITATHFSTYGTNNEEGSGLGLLLCHDFVAKNGGKLWFDSVEGEGSTFYFSVPLSERQ